MRLIEKNITNSNIILKYLVLSQRSRVVGQKTTEDNDRAESRVQCSTIEVITVQNSAKSRCLTAHSYFLLQKLVLPIVGHYFNNSPRSLANSRHPFSGESTFTTLLSSF